MVFMSGTHSVKQNYQTNFETQTQPEVQKLDKKAFDIKFPSFCHVAFKRHFIAMMSIHKLLKYCLVFSDFYDDIL